MELDLNVESDPLDHSVFRDVRLRLVVLASNNNCVCPRLSALVYQLAFIYSLFEATYFPISLRSARLHTNKGNPVLLKSAILSWSPTKLQPLEGDISPI